MIDLALNTLLYLFTTIFHPSAIQCPEGFDLSEGVRRTGAFVCSPAARCEECIRPPGPTLHLQIFCHPNQIPTQLPHWSGAICKTLHPLLTQ